MKLATQYMTHACPNKAMCKLMRLALPLTLIPQDRSPLFATGTQKQAFGAQPLKAAADDA